jgi:hypothetical protein
MNFSLIKKVILTVAVAALFIVPAYIFALQSNNVKTADAAKPQHYSNPCNHICQGYYQASNNNQPKNHCPVMYYSYLTNSYSSCTQVHLPKSSQSAKPSNDTYYYSNSYPNSYNSNYSYSSDYQYTSSNNYGGYNDQQYYNIPVSQPQQNYVDIYVDQPNYMNYTLKNSDSQEYKKSYCQDKYGSHQYVFQNWYCVK